MKKLVLAFILSATITHAQNAVPGTTPPTVPPAVPPEIPPPTVPPVTPPAGEAKAPGAKPEKVKPLSPGDQNFSKKISAVLQLQIKLAERAKGMKEKDKDMADWGTKKHKELTEKWTPFATLVGKYGFSDVATDITKKETGELAKLSKVKEEKFRQEFLELFAKESKNGHKDMENAPKMVQNAELKTWAEATVLMLKANAEEIETKFKEEKKRK